MSQSPAFHPDWLISFWLRTPVLNRMDPHILLIILLIVVVAIIMYRRRYNQRLEPDSEEKQFQLLLKKKAIIEKQMTELVEQKKLGELSEEQYKKNLKEYDQHLERVKKELIRFT
ncbi:membrane protein implicated in regulation of membrane protease activity [Cytobacillus eiseniae]|uniref:Membrane protein implicated in regulation of membrane protease activity n=1 Tax=Cytobacillus eiseniae TaxID=762947 RepID=A0ABS4RF30_9BACI|nr:hypothetical protein [Cytobacillus eiseniae]MBP2241495.1 membrane protein implicated in regulation of membrane protease activity [Cytobacillus eiseniae]